MQAISVPIYVFSFVVFSFILWKRLKEDYPTDQIFSFTLITFGVSFLFYFVSREFFPRDVFWGFSFGFIVSFWYGCLRMKLKFFEIVDAFLKAYLVFVGIYYLVEFKVDSIDVAILSGIDLFLVVFGLWLYSFFSAHFRGFGWYPSGKIGFAGLSSVGVYFLARGLFAILRGVVLSSWELTDLVSSFLLGLVLFSVVYLRSGRVWAYQFLQKFKKKRK